MGSTIVHVLIVKRLILPASERVNQVGQGADHDRPGNTTLRQRVDDDVKAVQDVLFSTDNFGVEEEKEDLEGRVDTSMVVEVSSYSRGFIRHHSKVVSSASLFVDGRVLVGQRSFVSSRDLCRILSAGSFHISHRRVARRLSFDLLLGWLLGFCVGLFWLLVRVAGDLGPRLVIGVGILFQCKPRLVLCLLDG